MPTVALPQTLLLRSPRPAIASAWPDAALGLHADPARGQLHYFVSREQRGNEASSHLDFLPLSASRHAPLSVDPGSVLFKMLF